MNFNGQPYFKFANHVLLERNQDGNWIGVDAEGVPANFTDEEVRGGIAIQTDELGRGLYAVIDSTRTDGPHRFLIDYKEDVVHIEGAGRPLSVKEFFSNAVRTGSGGEAICSFIQPLHEQYTICQEHSHATYHMLDIAEIASKRRDSEDPLNRMDAGLFDIVSSGIDDNMSFMDLMAKVTAKGIPTHEALGLDQMIEGDWAEIREFPQFMITPIRTLFGQYMTELLGDFPFERVSRLHLPLGTDLAMHLEEYAEIVSVDKPFLGGNIIPGYKTSEVAHFASDKFEAIVFSDMMGTYIYAWQPQPKLDNEPPAPRM